MFNSRTLERELAPDGSVALKLNPSKENDCLVFTSLNDAELWLSRMSFANAYRLQRCAEVGCREGDHFVSLWRQKKAMLRKWLEILEANSNTCKRSYASVVKDTPSQEEKVH